MGGNSGVVSSRDSPSPRRVTAAREGMILFPPSELRFSLGSLGLLLKF